jgi:hypothetical protein
LILFICGLVAAQWATKFDAQILRVLLNSSKLKAVYDPGKSQPWGGSDYVSRASLSG